MSATSDMRPHEPKDARTDQDVKERLHGKKKPRVALGKTKMRPINKSIQGKAAPNMFKPWGAPKNDTQRKTKIANYSRNATKLSRHFIEWQDGSLECKDCGRSLTENKFNLIANERCRWERSSKVKYKDIKDTRERRYMERRWPRRARINKSNNVEPCGAAFNWFTAKRTTPEVAA